MNAFPQIYRDDSISIAVFPRGVRLAEEEIDMLLYTTGTGYGFMARRRPFAWLKYFRR